MMTHQQHRKMVKYDTLHDHLEKSREFCDQVAKVADRLKSNEELKTLVAAFYEQLHYVDCDLAP